ncbi:MAG: metal-dependent transcriptional regulator [Brevinematia bacterium]
MSRKKDGEISRGLKKYLKAISEIEAEKGIVRVSDIANKLNVSMSSVSSSLRKLSSMGYVNYEKHFFVRFTVKGKSLADRLHYNFTILYRFLVDILKVDEATARQQADEICTDTYDVVVQKIDHYLRSNPW